MLIPPHYLDAVAVLEDAEMSGDTQVFHPVATGTLIAYNLPDQSIGGPDQVAMLLCLVTNKHVIEDKADLWIRFNQGSGSERFRIGVKDEDGNDMFEVSKDFDVAVAALHAGALRSEGAEFDALPEHALMTMDEIESEKVVGGDAVFVLGFPMGITGTQKKYAVVRGGVIARVDKELVDDTGGFLIDCPVFPGNSGGPVVLRPEAVALGHDEPRTRTRVIGIVNSYVPYVDTAISQQTQRPRISFEENSGLASVVPVDAVNELAHGFLAGVDSPEQKGEIELGQMSAEPDEVEPSSDAPTSE